MTENKKYFKVLLLNIGIFRESFHYDINTYLENINILVLAKLKDDLDSIYQEINQYEIKKIRNKVNLTVVTDNRI